MAIFFIPYSDDSDGSVRTIMDSKHFVKEWVFRDPIVGKSLSLFK